MTHTRRRHCETTWKIDPPHQALLRLHEYSAPSRLIIIRNRRRCNPFRSTSDAVTNLDTQSLFDLRAKSMIAKRGTRLQTRAQVADNFGIEMICKELAVGILAPDLVGTERKIEGMR